MRRGLALLFVIAVAGVGWAQEADEEARPEPVHRIKVLQNPYDLASFYRSSQDANYFGLQAAPTDASSRYPIASYYRSRQSGFVGYMPVPAPYGPGRYGSRRRVDDSLFLVAPFLAPVGPLAGSFFEKR